MTPFIQEYYIMYIERMIDNFTWVIPIKIDLINKKRLTFSEWWGIKCHPWGKNDLTCSMGLFIFLWTGSFEKMLVEGSLRTYYVLFMGD